MFDLISGQNNARVGAYRQDTKAGTAAIQRQARLGAAATQAGAYGLAAGQRGGMGSAMAVREAQKRAAMGQQAATTQALQQQQQLEQQAASQYAQQRQASDQANANIEGENAKGMQRLVGMAAGAAMMSDERAKKLSEENDGLRSTLLRMVGRGEPATAERRQLQLPPQYKGQYSPPPMRDEADAIEAEKRFRMVNQYALRQQLQEEEQRAARLQSQREQLAHVREQEGLDAQQIPQEVSGEVVSDERGKQSIMPLDRGMMMPASMGPSMSGSGRGSADAGAPRERAARSAPEQVASQQAAAQSQEPSQEASKPADDQRRKFIPLSGGLALSDEHEKMGMGMHGKMDFPSGVEPVEYEYRDEVQGLPGTAPGKQYGLLAQDLEKSKEGATVVAEDPTTGMKMVDTGRLAMLATAKIAEMEARLDQMEGAKKRRKESR